MDALNPENLKGATVTITQGDETTVLHFDDEGEVIPPDDVPDTSVTVFLPTPGREDRSTVPVRKHRAAWQAIVDSQAGLQAGKGSHAKGESPWQVVADALASSADEWLDIEVPAALVPELKVPPAT